MRRIKKIQTKKLFIRWRRVLNELLLLPGDEVLVISIPSGIKACDFVRTARASIRRHMKRRQITHRLHVRILNSREMFLYLIKEAP